MDAVEAIAKHIEKERAHGFRILPGLGEPYSHMGALLADAVLQAAINYERVVAPRVREIIRRYPNATTTTAFLRILAAEGASAVLSWQPGRKPDTLLKLAELLASEGVEREGDLRRWLQDPDNLVKLTGIKWVGPKTVDYLRVLAGIPALAIDTHLRRFVADAGVVAATYDEARTILEATADRLAVDRALLDYSIWKYMSEKRRV